MTNMESKVDGVHMTIESQGKELVRALVEVRDSLIREMRGVAAAYQENTQQISALRHEVQDADQRSIRALDELAQVKGALPGRMQKRL